MFTFDVKPDDAPEFQVTATSRDVAHWERTGKGRSLAQIGNNARMTDLVDIAAVAAIRHNLWAGTVAEFRDQCDVDPVDMTDADDDDRDEAESGPFATDH